MQGSIDEIQTDQKKVGQQTKVDLEEEKAKEEKIRKNQKIQQLASPKLPSWKRRKDKTILPSKQELSQVVSILKNSKTRDLLTSEEQLAFWANSQKQKV